jgi:hypothetical protein
MRWFFVLARASFLCLTVSFLLEPEPVRKTIKERKWAYPDFLEVSAFIASNKFDAVTDEKCCRLPATVSRPDSGQLCQRYRIYAGLRSNRRSPLCESDVISGVAGCGWLPAA